VTSAGIEDECRTTRLPILIANGPVEEHPLLRIKTTFVASPGDSVEISEAGRVVSQTPVTRDTKYLAYADVHFLAS
jgi:hypothetical protein